MSNTIKRFLEWEKGLRENAKKVDAERKQQRLEGNDQEEKAREKASALNAKAQKKREKELKKYGNLDAVLSEAEREKILSEEVRRFMGWGRPWRVEGKGTTWAQLINPAGDPIGTGGAIMAIGTMGLSLAAHKTRRGRENDKRLYIEVYPNGMIERSGSLLHGGKDYSHVPRT